jgi:hypothetical protein
VVANSTPAIWALFDKPPLGVLDLPNVAIDVVLHFVIAAISVVVLLVQVRGDRAPARQVAVGLGPHALWLALRSVSRGGTVTAATERHPRRRIVRPSTTDRDGMVRLDAIGNPRRTGRLTSRASSSGVSPEPRGGSRDRKREPSAEAT